MRSVSRTSALFSGLVIATTITACAPAADSPAPTPPAAPEPAAPEAADSACDAARALLIAVPGGDADFDVEAARSSLMAQAGINQMRTLEEVAAAGAAAAPLRAELRTLMATTADDRTRAAAARAWAAASAGAADEIVALMRDPDTPLAARFELAAALGLQGELDGLVAAAASPGVARAAAERGLLVGRRHLRAIRTLFDDNGRCASFVDDAFCADLARDLLAYEPDLFDDAPTGEMALVAAEERALRGDPGAAEAWVAAAERATRRAAVAASVERLASVGAAHIAGSQLATLAADASLGERERQLAAYLATWYATTDATEPADDADALAIAAWGLRAAARGDQLPEGWPEDALAAVGRRANPFHAQLLLTIAYVSGSRAAAEEAAGTRFPRGFNDLLRAMADDDAERVLRVVLTAGDDDALAADAFFVVSRADRIAWKARFLASTDGTASRRAAIAARIGTDNPEIAAAIAGELTTLPPFEVVRWLAASRATEPLTALVDASLVSENPASRRHASLVASSLRVEADPTSLRDAIVAPRPRQGLELRDTRTTALRALLVQGTPSLEDATALRERALAGDVGFFETAAYLDRALRAHCSE